MVGIPTTPPWSITVLFTRGSKGATLLLLILLVGFGWDRRGSTVDVPSMCPHGLAKLLSEILLMASLFFIILHYGLKPLFQSHTSTHFVRRSKQGFLWVGFVFGPKGMCLGLRALA